MRSGDVAGVTTRTRRRGAERQDAGHWRGDVLSAAGVADVHTGGACSITCACGVGNPPLVATNPVRVACCPGARRQGVVHPCRDKAGVHAGHQQPGFRDPEAAAGERNECECAPV